MSPQDRPKSNKSNNTSTRDEITPTQGQNQGQTRPKISPTRALFHPSYDLSGSISAYSGMYPANEDEARVPLLRQPSQDGEDEEPTPWQKLQSHWESFWVQSKGMILVMLSQFFGASMNVMTKVLEKAGKDEKGDGLHPFQILFARMSVTVLASYLYMWYARVPQPLGTRPVLGLLFLRALGGFFGVYGLYYSVQYMPLSEATVLTFLAPILSCYACSLFIPNERFTRKQQFAGLVSLVGVVLIARPFAFLRSGAENTDAEHPVKQHYRTMAVIVSLFGVIGSATAYTSIRMIGKRTHPLVSVTWFSMLTTLISLIAMLSPWIPFQLPRTGLEWTLLTGLGICGFLLQFLLTAGLAYVPPTKENGSSGSKATSMLYTQMVFALFYDKVVWGNVLVPVSWVGSVLIIGSALSVAMARYGKQGSQSDAKTEEGDQAKTTAGDEGNA